MCKKEILVNGYAYPSIEPAVLEAWMQNLTLVSAFSYGFTQEGDLIQLDDAKIIEVAKQNGVQPMMVLTPTDETGGGGNELVRRLLSNPAAQQNLINNIESNLKSKGLSGVDFDFEYVFAENRDQYTNLVADAAVQLNAAGYLVTVALPPKVSADQEGLLYEGVDYFGMGQAANFVLIMTYEWGYTYGPPMAIAPINEVRRVMDYALSEIPQEKLLMGIPNYGYDWRLPFVRGESRAEKISNTEAPARAERYDAPVFFDEAAKEPFFNYIDAEGNVHEVWFQDARSMRAKLGLVRELGIAGASYWNIMDDFPANTAVLHDMFRVMKIE